MSPMVQLFGSGFGHAGSTTKLGAVPVFGTRGAVRSTRRSWTAAFRSASAALVPPPLCAASRETRRGAPIAHARIATTPMNLNSRIIRLRTTRYELLERDRHRLFLSQLPLPRAVLRVHLERANAVQRAFWRLHVDEPGQHGGLAVQANFRAALGHRFVV